MKHVKNLPHINNKKPLLWLMASFFIFITGIIMVWTSLILLKKLIWLRTGSTVRLWWTERLFHSLD